MKLVKMLMIKNQLEADVNISVKKKKSKELLCLSNYQDWEADNSVKTVNCILALLIIHTIYFFKYSTLQYNYKY